MRLLATAGLHTQHLTEADPRASRSLMRLHLGRTMNRRPYLIVTLQTPRRKERRSRKICRLVSRFSSVCFICRLLARISPGETSNSPRKAVRSSLRLNFRRTIRTSVARFARRRRSRSVVGFFLRRVYLAID